MLLAMVPTTDFFVLIHKIQFSHASVIIWKKGQESIVTIGLFNIGSSLELMCNVMDMIGPQR